MDDLLLRRSGMRKLKHKTKSIDIPNLHQRRGAFCEKYRHLSAGDSPVSSDALDEAMDSSPPNKEADDEVSLFNEQVTEVFPTSAFDIVGPRKNSRYPWQRDVGVQCNLLRERLSSSDCSASRLSDSSDQYSVKVSSVDSGTGIDSNRTAAKAYLRQTIDLFDDHRGPRVRAIKDEWFTKRRSAALTEPDLDYLQHIPTMIRPKPKLSRMHSADSMMTKEWKSFNGGTCGRRAISVVQDPDTYRCSGCLSGRDSFSSTMPLLDDRDSLKSIPSMDIIGRADTLQSPRVSPVPWLEQGIPSLVVTDTKSTEAKDLERTQSVQSSDSEERYLQVPPRVVRQQQLVRSDE
ncbi:hypothetical protein CAPTEDRAFT_216142 [Capitella teleta]|uniref:Uncharacterized protein n=1 Tax=Capitella teleta TaxID=283909 RepID=R7UFY0_CAPTE|nr:hypothetical protein CAPTEDRAFT_216142 [Capitella teleta]|eukprot:ELU05090.1 hypothetical protein CAPTEDRAFT_216142 [Capitella teleta]